jgi:hypothetical protein
MADKIMHHRPISYFSVFPKIIRCVQFLGREGARKAYRYVTEDYAGLNEEQLKAIEERDFLKSPNDDKVQILWECVWSFFYFPDLAEDYMEELTLQEKTKPSWYDHYPNW